MAKRLRGGEAWGRVGPFPAGSPVVETTAELSHLVTTALLDGQSPPTIGLAGGDLCRSLGGRGDRGRFDAQGRCEVALLPCDAWRIDYDDGSGWAMAHFVAGSLRPYHRIIAGFNAAHLGPWNPAPRAHPGDGLLDLLDARLGWRDFLAARRRLGSGQHVPHPDIREQRAMDYEVELERPLPLCIDSIAVGEVTRIRASLEAQQIEVAV